jgi:CheY-like chemotaxis protein/nitrogen-specific signal transduction histidine kinase
LGVFCYAVTQFCLDRARRNWRRRFQEEEARRNSAEAANKAKAFFLTSMSHEIRAPLNAIVGFTDLALKTPLNPELREYLGTVRASADWLTHVVDEIQDYSRMEAGALSLTQDQFSLTEIVRSAINIAQPLADQRKLPLRFHLDAALPAAVQGDSTRLLQVLFNLIENAIKFTTSGSVLVIAALEHRGLDSVTVRLSVADTGLGIVPERLQYLFEPLVRPASSLDRRARTCGFGLPICQRVLQMMGSELEVQSRPGVGSTFAFSLTLPVILEEKRMEAPARSVSQKNGKRLSILVADDNAASRRLAQILLQGAGHSVTEAVTGLEAVSLFTAGKFDLVLMDVEMPDLNGMEATKAIRKTEPDSHQVPIYAVTAHATDSDRNLCLQAGMTGFITKPFSVEALLHLVSAHGGSTGEHREVLKAATEAA